LGVACTGKYNSLLKLSVLAHSYRSCAEMARYGFKVL
jgi:hypothetical protein